MGKTANLHLKTYIDKGIKHAVYLAISPLDGVERLHGFRQVGDLPLIVIAGGAKEDYLGSGVVMSGNTAPAVCFCC